jgi:hypothetical protein
MSKVLLNKRKRKRVHQEWTIHRHRQHLAEQHRMSANTPPPPQKKQRKHTRQKFKTMDTIDPLQTRWRNPGAYEELR